MRIAQVVLILRFCITSMHPTLARNLLFQKYHPLERAGSTVWDCTASNLRGKQKPVDPTVLSGVKWEGPGFQYITLKLIKTVFLKIISVTWDIIPLKMII